MKGPEAEKRRESLVQAARGLASADILFSDALVFNPFHR